MHSWIVGIVIVTDLFAGGFLLKELKTGFEIIRLVFYVFLIVWGMVTLVVNCDSKLLEGNQHHLPILKTIDELIERPNINEYFKLFLLLSIGQHRFDFFKTPGLILYLTFTFFLITISLFVLYRDYQRNRTWTTTIIGNLFLVTCLLFFSKHTYSRINGDQAFNSFFEKPEYHTKYYVNLFPETSKSKNYRLVADIHVYEEEEEYDDKSYLYKVISIEKVYFNNGGYLYFDDCRLEVGEKTYCIDQKGRGWYIELTNIKVKR